MRRSNPGHFALDFLVVVFAYSASAIPNSYLIAKPRRNWRDSVRKNP